MAEHYVSFSVEEGEVWARCDCGWSHHWIPNCDIDEWHAFITIADIWHEHIHGERSLPHFREVAASG